MGESLSEYFEQALNEATEHLFEHFGFNLKDAMPTAYLVLAWLLAANPKITETPAPSLASRVYAINLYDRVRKLAPKSPLKEELIHWLKTITLCDSVHFRVNNELKKLRGIVEDLRDDFNQATEEMAKITKEGETP